MEESIYGAERMSYKDLIKGSFTLTFASLISNLGAMLLLPLYVSLITPTQFGIVGLLQPVTEGTSALMIFGIYAAMRRDVIDLEDNTKEMGIYFSTIHIFLLIWNLVLIVGLSLPVTRSIYTKVLGLQQTPSIYLGLSIINGSFIGFQMLANSYFQYRRRYTFLTVTSVIGFVLTNIFSLSIIFSTKDGVLGKLLGSTLAMVVMLTLLYRPFIKIFTLGFRWKYIKGCLYFGYPLVITSFLGMVVSKSSRFILANTVTMNDLGIYTVAYTIASVLSFVIVSFNSVWIPQFFKMMKDGVNDESIGTYIVEFSVVLGIVSIFGQLFINVAAKILLNDKYVGVAHFVTIMLPIFVVMGISQVISNYFQYYQRNIIQTLIVVLMAGINVTLYWFFIPRFGLDVAIISEVLLRYFILLLYFVVILKMFKHRFGYLKITVVIIFVMNPILFKIAENTWSVPISILMKLIYFFVALFVYSKLIPKENIALLISNFKHKPDVQID